MANTNFISAANLFGWGQSFNATGKFPLIAKRVWETYDDMIAFVSDTSDVCPAGVVLTVVNDTDSSKNGAYFVASCPTLENPELEVKVEKIGSGEKLLAETHADAVILATAANIGATVYVETETEDGNSGLYIITGEGTIERLGTTTATGDLSSDVADLQSRVAANESAIGIINGDVTVDGSIDSKIYETQNYFASLVENVNAKLGDGVTAENTVTAQFEAINSDIETLNGDYTVEGSIDKKITVYSEFVNNNFVKTEGYVAYSETEKTKLANIEEGAQVNVIEVVKVNGATLTVGDDKSVDVIIPTAPVQSVADGDKVLNLSESGVLSSTLSYTREDVDGVDSLVLKGVNDTVIGSIPVADFVADGILTSVELVEGTDGTFRFTFNVDKDGDNVNDYFDVDFSKFIDVYTAGNGVTVVDNVISAKVKEGDAYIEVTTDGIASKGIDDAITVAKDAIIGTAEDTAESLTIQGVKKYAANIVATHETAVNTALESKVNVSDYNTFVENTNAAISAIKVTDVDTTASNGVALAKSEAGVISVSVTPADVAASLVGATGEIGPVSGNTIKLGQAITDGDEENPTEIISATSSVHAAIQSLAGQIQAAVAGGITGISGDEYITVGGTATSKTLAVNVAKIGTYMVDNSSALKVDETTGKLSLEWEEVQ